MSEDRIEDNIAEAPEAAKVVPVATSFNNLMDILSAIDTHLGLKGKYSVDWGFHIIDGGPVVFKDKRFDTVVATAKVRISNALVVNKEDGKMYVSVYLADLAFTRTTVLIE